MRRVETELWLLRAGALFPLVWIGCLASSMPVLGQQAGLQKQPDDKPPMLAELENRTDDLRFS